MFKTNKFSKKIRYLFEALIARIGIFIFYHLPPATASNITSFLARVIGKRHSTTRLADKNISAALPNFSSKERKVIIDDMWDNLGRIVGEFPHICKLSPENLVEKYITMSDVSQQNIESLKLAPQKGGIIFSGHIGNWEVGPKVFINKGLNVSTVYRPLNNPYVEDFTSKMRQIKLIPKGSKGNRQIIEAIKNGEYVIILADQKISEGEKIKFFHGEAITTTSIARIAIKYNVPIIPARSIRVNREFKFIVEVESPLVFKNTMNLNEDVLRVSRLINEKLESWISQYPSQWFWVHNRWKKNT